MKNLIIKGINFTGWTVHQINHRLRQPNGLNLTELYYLLEWYEENNTELVQWFDYLNQSTGFYVKQLRVL